MMHALAPVSAPVLYPAPFCAAFSCIRETHGSVFKHLCLSFFKFIKKRILPLLVILSGNCKYPTADLWLGRSHASDAIDERRKCIKNMAGIAAVRLTFPS